MNRARFHILLQYFKEDVISEEEWRELLGMVKTGRYDDQLEDDLLISLDSIGKKNKWTEDIEREMWAGIQTKIQGQSKKSNYRIWIAAAAVLLVMLTAGLLFFKAEHLPSSLKTNTARIEADILPGGNKAVLTLPDGKRVVLTDSTIKQLANQAGGSIIKAGNGILVYNMTSLAGNAGVITGKEIFNTISTPRGGSIR
ncbi:hypothetical protein [Pedobacter steynii]